MRQLLQRVWHLLRQRRVETELADEMEFHREMKQQELEQRGVDPIEAGFAARRSLGNATLAKEDARAVWIWPWLDGLRQDATYAFRQMRREPGVTLVILIVLALGIGATTTMFSAVESVLIKPLPFPNPDRLVNVREVDTRTGSDLG